MSQEPNNENGKSSIEASYAHSGSAAAPAFFSARTAEKQAGFLLPHLSSGMSVIDCGCGPGSITAGLANIVAPGEVIGIDIDPKQIELAGDLNNKQGLRNVRFETQSIYDLPFADNSFDAAFSNAVLSHLQTPLAAVKEIYRIVKPGGVVGIRLLDAGGDLLSPSDPLLAKFLELYYQLVDHHGGDTLIARHQRKLMRQAGFSRIQVSATCEYYSTLEATRHWGQTIAAVLQEEEFANQIIEATDANRELLVDVSKAWQNWSENPDAFFSQVWCQAIGWVD
ncbi:MAG: methyltransferase domain-containing protein [Candidatus Competibacteraceae bacterium]|nr:methyltransferase domain-containing protein [Candidatus Competibacteraceae bacterium]